MNDATRGRRTWPTAIALALAALVIGAVVGAPLNGRAASEAVPTNTATPTLSGTPQENGTLTASNGTWSNTPTSYAYAWSRCDANGNSCATISGATTISYKLQSADVGHTIRVTVTATNADGSGEATSVPSAVVSSAAAPANTATPTIGGTPQEKSTLTADPGTWTGSPTSYAYAWSRCDKNGDTCTAISGATAKTYTLASSDVGSTLRVTVTATNSGGSGRSTSAPTGTVASASAPTNTALPTVSGTVQVGSTLTASNGSWNGGPTGYAYSWSRCDANGNSCATISGATAQTYQLKQVDVGTTLRANVTATSSGGSTTATSVPTGVVPAPAAPVVNGCPSGSGVIQVGSLSAPARLAIDQQTVSPGVVTPAASSIQLHFRVTACNGRPVQGATVYATAIPYNQYSVVQGTTGADGTVTMTATRLSGFPAARRQQLLAVFVRATQPGQSVLGGVSSRRLVTFPVSLH